MALRDELYRAFPRAAQIAGVQSVPGLGSITQGGKEIFDAGQELQCDLNSMVGPFACMHNEHVQIVRNQQALKEQMDRIENLLNAHFKAP